MAVDPGTGFNNNNQDRDMATTVTLGVRMAALVKLVDDLESKLMEKINFLEEQNQQFVNMEHTFKSFIYDTESFNDFMFVNVKNYEYLLTGLKGFKPTENLDLFRSYKDYLDVKRNKGYQNYQQHFNPGYQQPFNPFNLGQHPHLKPGVWQGSRPVNTGSQNFGQFSTQAQQAANTLMAIAGLNLDFEKAMALVEAALKEANK